MPRGSVDVSINMPQSCYNFNQVIVLAANQLFDAECKSEGDGGLLFIVKTTF